MALTPMMRQYFEVKDRYTDCILFFRLGDFYEMFFDDAKIASKELELVLTGRECGLEEKAAMCGIPYHASKSYISRLIAKGYKVAICEQVEDPAIAKGIVKRDVVKIITPGTFSDENEEEYKNRYVSVIFEENGMLSLASSDISTGEFKVTSFNSNNSLLFDELTKVSPKEILVDLNIKEDILEEIKRNIPALITVKNYFDFICTNEELISKFSLEQINSLDAICVKSSSVLLKYIFETQKMNLSNINHIERYYIVNYMTIDSSSRKNLELVESLKEKGKKGTLIWVMDKTSTSMGGRTLRKWIEEPLTVKERIEERLNAVDELSNKAYFNEDLRNLLKNIYDIERIVGKISNQNVNGKDLNSLKVSLEKIPEIKSFLSQCNSKLLKDYFDNLDELLDIKKLLQDSIIDDPALTIKDGNIIRIGYNSDIDKLKEAKINGKEWIASLETREREFTGIKSLKVGYNKVFGYYIEISKSNYASIPEGRYVRKQTLANAERFITQELKEMEEEILGAEEKLAKLEYELFIEIRNKVELEIARLQKTAKILGDIDVLSTFAIIAIENNYVKPNLNDNGLIEIIDGRHPVVEKVIPNGEFVSNNSLVDNKSNQMLLITGPNMAGKSTYMRQVALITIMAQIGSFIPAKEANISICDKVFTRIGASDDLAGGKSTFMVEMWEVSNILKNATQNSLVLLDEVGRGTSTYDGLSIAWSVIEHICSVIKCKTLFATHYHELTKLEGLIPGVKNYSVAVKEINDTIIFLRKIVEGGADQSYGVEVAKLAGIPQEVILRAKEILKGLEESSSNLSVIENRVDSSNIKEEVIVKEEIVIVEKCKKCEKLKDAKISNCVDTNVQKNLEEVQLDFSSVEKDNLINEIVQLDIMSLNPIEAMTTLYNLYKSAKQIK